MLHQVILWLLQTVKGCTHDELGLGRCAGALTPVTSNEIRGTWVWSDVTLDLRHKIDSVVDFFVA